MTDQEKPKDDSKKRPTILDVSSLKSRLSDAQTERRKKAEETTPKVLAEGPGSVLANEWDTALDSGDKKEIDLTETPIPEHITGDEAKPSLGRATDARPEDIEAIESMFPETEVEAPTLGVRPEDPDHIAALEEGKPPKPAGATDRFGDLPREQTTDDKHFHAGGDGAEHLDQPVPVTLPDRDFSEDIEILDSPLQLEEEVIEISTPLPPTVSSEIQSFLDKSGDDDAVVVEEPAQKGSLHDTDVDLPAVEAEDPSLPDTPDLDQPTSSVMGTSLLVGAPSGEDQEEIPTLDPIVEEPVEPAEDGDDALVHEPEGSPTKAVAKRVHTVMGAKQIEEALLRGEAPTETKPFTDFFEEARKDSERKKAIKDASEAPTDVSSDVSTLDDDTKYIPRGDLSDLINAEEKMGPDVDDAKAPHKKPTTEVGIRVPNLEESDYSENQKEPHARSGLFGGVVAGAIGFGLAAILLLPGPLGLLAPNAEHFDGEVKVAYTRAKDGRVKKVGFTPDFEAHYKLKVLIPVSSDLPQAEVEKFITDAFDNLNKAVTDYKNIERELKTAKMDLNSAKIDLKGAQAIQKLMKPKDYKKIEARIAKLEGERNALFNKIEEYSGLPLSGPLKTAGNALYAIRKMNRILNDKKTGMKKAETALQTLVADISTTSSMGAYFRNGISKEMLYRFCDADLEVGLLVYQGLDSYTIFQTDEGAKIRIVSTNGRVYIEDTPNLFNEAVEKARAHLLGIDQKLANHIKKHKGLTIILTDLGFYAGAHEAVYGERPNPQQIADMQKVMSEMIDPAKVKELVYDHKAGAEITLELE